MKTLTMNLAKWTMVFLFGFCLMNTPIFADNFFNSDTLDCEIESVVFECEGIEYDFAAALAWHQQNIDKLKANCIGHQSGIIIMSSLENLAILANPLCEPCTVNGHYEIIDTVGGMTTIDVKNATFEIVDTSPPVFIDNRNRHDTIECNHRNAIIHWLLGKQSSLVVTKCKTLYTASVPSFISSQKSEKSETREYSVSISGLHKNVVDETLYLTILDNTPPMVSCSPSNMVLECNGDIENEQQADLWNQENLIRLENCSKEYCSDVFVTSDYDFNLLDSCGLAEVTYTITDEYENSVIQKATFTIMDINLPTVNCDPLDAFFECKDLSSNIFNAQTWYENNLEVLTNCAFDECGDVTITSDFNTDNLTNDCESTGTVLTTFTVADNCGNSITKTATLTFNDNNSLCENILIQPAANQLTISNLSASNTIVKVFDQNYQIIYDCSGDCPEMITTPNLNTGETYHTDIQFYNENWNFICEDKQSIEIVGGSEPCDTSVCQGDVILRTQAEVDAFCGCEVIEGNVLIGNSNGEDISNTDINNLNSLKQTKIIKGSLTIGQTQLVNLSNLENLEIIENSFAIVFNNQLENYLGLDKLKLIGSFVSMTNPKLESFMGLNSLDTVRNSIYINGNQALNSLNGFNQLNVCGSFDLVKCPVIESLEGLDNLKQVEQRFAIRENPNLLSTRGIGSLEEVSENLVIANNSSLMTITGLDNLQRVGSSLIIQENDNLENIEGLVNLKFVGGLGIRENPRLNDCCSIIHLIDEDVDNGSIQESIDFTNNAQFCNSIEAILQNCQNPPPTCENIQILTQNNQIIIEGLTAPNEIVKVFDQNYQIIYDCSGDCPETITVSNLNTGEIYHTDIQFYDENWAFICVDRQDVEIKGGSEPCDASICQGDVILLTQAEVDAFCGCEVIEGNVLIGNSNGEDISNTDINNLNSLKQTKIIKGSLTIGQTQLVNLSNLENLEIIENSFAIVFNNQLENYLGLDKLKLIGSFVSMTNPKLESFMGLNSLDTVRNSIYINGNQALNSLNGFNQLNVCGSFDLVKCPVIESLEGLDNLKQVEQRFAIRENPNLLSTRGIGSLEEISGELVIANNSSLMTITGLDNLQRVGSSLIIQENDNLENIEGLVNLKFVGGLGIRENPRLNDCCSIIHLIDENPDNGSIQESIGITNNAQFCNSIEAILQNCQNPPPTCENIQILTEDNQIIIEGLTAPNEIVKIFDQNYQIIYDCSSDCPETITVSNLNTGEIYHTDIQFYDENWAFICVDRQDVEIKGGSEPCDTSICQGDVILSTQAEVDAFCGCTVIEGDLLIGVINSSQKSDINNLGPLNSLEKVDSIVSIINTNLIDLTGLNQLKEAYTIGIIQNDVLKSLHGLEQVEKIEETLSIANNNNLEEINALSNLSEVGGQLNIQDNERLTNIKSLSRIRKVITVILTNNASLVNLDGLENLDSIFGGPLTGGVTDLNIISNQSLQDISALENLKFVAGDLTILNNPLLEDCCPILHLIDEDSTNGIILDNINLNQNAAGFCNSTIEIIESCNMPPSSCESIQISTDNNQIVIEGLTAPNEIVKVFDQNYQIIYDCLGNCPETITVSNLNTGEIYHTDIQFYDENWQPICNKVETVQVGETAQNRSADLLPTDFVLYPNPAQTETFIDLSKLKGTKVQLALFNQFGQKVHEQVIEKATEQKAKIEVAAYQNGLYILKIKAIGKRPIAKKMIINRLY